MIMTETKVVGTSQSARTVRCPLLGVIEPDDPDVIPRGRQSLVLVHERPDADVCKPSHQVGVIRNQVMVAEHGDST